MSSLYAFREDSERHAEYHAWLQNALNGTEPVALFEPVLSAVLRIATHPAIFKPPSPRDAVEALIDTCLAAPAAKGCSCRRRPLDALPESLHEGRLSRKSDSGCLPGCDGTRT